tara:strand:- start:126 stop:347 length:222 start_codon:yes stop_codon:yes gene_type:complete
MINEKRMYAPGEVAEIAKAYRAMVFNIAVGSSMREMPLETARENYMTSVPDNVDRFLDVKDIFENFNNGEYEK